MQLYNKLRRKNEQFYWIKQVPNALPYRSTTCAIGNPQLFRDHLFLAWDKLEVLGRIYVAHEGINGQLSVPAPNFDAFKAHLDSIDFLKDIRLNIAVEQDMKSFLKLTVKVRNKIVADGLEDDSFDVTQKGKHVNAEEFNALLADPNTICVDMRNNESEIGHFKGAVTPDVDTFRESLPIIEEDLAEHKSDKNLLMYCTGGFAVKRLRPILSIKVLKTYSNWKAVLLSTPDR